MSNEIPILPQREAIKHWQGRVPVTADDYRALEARYRVQAFAVSRLNALHQVQAVKNSLDTALKSGQSMREWRESESMVDVLKKAGWGTHPYRLDTIYRTNILGAYHAGRWKQAARGNPRNRYAMYDAVMDGVTRPTHAAQDGKIYRLDHPFWREWWPSNGFN